jgi:hypothetical protein
MKLIIVEGFRDEITPDMKYYAFDWDDNIMFMPTKIILKTEDGSEIGMGTEDFAEHRVDIGKNPFEYKGETIVGFAENPFRNFGVSGDKKFIIDSLLSKTGPAWDDFVECINGGSIFSIITARGHSPETLKQSVKNLIEVNYKGLSKKELVKNLRKYREIYGEEDMSDLELINEYLDMCKFYPVTYGEGSAQNPEEGKVKAIKEFSKYVMELAKELHQTPYFKNDVSNNFIPQIGFSDDDLRNLAKMKSALKDDPENIVQLYSTHGGEKKKYD